MLTEIGSSLLTKMQTKNKIIKKTSKLASIQKKGGYKVTFTAVNYKKNLASI